MEFTSAAANKYVKSLEEEKQSLLKQEKNTDTYRVPEGKSLEEEKPEYDYSETRKLVDDIDNKIAKVKHGINIFNTMAAVGRTDDMTVDEALVRLAQLNNKKRLLASMKDVPQKELSTDYGLSGAMAVYRNYDAKLVQEDFRKVSKEIANLQMAIDTVNLTKTFKVEI